MAIVQTGLTLDEFLKLPEEKPHLEYLDGVVTQKMAAKGPHGTLHLSSPSGLIGPGVRASPRGSSPRRTRTGRIARRSFRTSRSTSSIACRQRPKG